MSPKEGVTCLVAATSTDRIVTEPTAAACIEKDTIQSKSQIERKKKVKERKRKRKREKNNKVKGTRSNNR